MPAFLDLRQQRKIKALDELFDVLEKDRQNKLKIVQCHGVFDLLHPGHIRHFQEAKSQGDILVVTVTPDRFVNKGPGRPVFNELLRMEAIAALELVDYVALNDSPDAISAIRKVRPHTYVKGLEYKNHSDDVTGKISQEVRAVEEEGGAVYYTDDIVFSSSSILNRHFDSMPSQVKKFIDQLKETYTCREILKMVEGLSSLKVLVIGDAIIDEYQHTIPLGQSGKGIHMVARCMGKEVFLGGSLIIANHVAEFAGEVTLITALGKKCSYLDFIRQKLFPKIETQFTYLDEAATLIKKRYILKDGSALTKLFETYSNQEEFLNAEQTNSIIQFLKNTASQYDLVLICDFGNGFTNHQLVEALSDLPAVLALNTQTNSGNRGYNVITNYRRANYISVNEPELRLSAHDKNSSIEGIAVDICQLMQCKTISVTQGVNGVFCYSEPNTFIQIPALNTNIVDRIGAGDSYLSLFSLCMAQGLPPIIGGFVGSAAAAMSVQMVGNHEAIKKAPLCKFISRLMK